MMLALVKCLFWTVSRVTEPELVLAHLSFSPLTSEYLLHLGCTRPVIQSVFIGSKDHYKKKRWNLFSLYALRTFFLLVPSFSFLMETAAVNAVAALHG